jgi:hypothetical protein
MHDPHPALILLDGDKQPAKLAPNPDDLPASADATLLEVIGSCTGVKAVSFGADGGDDPDAGKKKAQLQRDFLRFVHDRVRFLPAQCPEDIVLRAVDTEAKAPTSQKAKEALVEKLKALGMPITSDVVDNSALLLLSQAVAAKNPEALRLMKEIRELLRPYVDELGGGD